jgi:hypothetical protein
VSPAPARWLVVVGLPGEVPAAHRILPGDTRRADVLSIARECARVWARPVRVWACSADGDRTPAASFPDPARLRHEVTR